MNSNMQNENQSDMSWKDKLQDADALDDIRLSDKNAAWLKLQHRMQDQPKRMKPFWYWIAAACILSAIVLPFSFNKKSNVGQSVAEAPVNSPTSKSNNKIGSTILPVEKNEPVVIKKIASTAATKKNKSDNRNNKLARQMVVIDKLNEPATLPLSNIISDSSFINKIPLIVTALSPAKKKLKVVHINELGEPISELNSRTSKDDYSMIQFGIIRQEPPANTRTIKSSNSIFSKQKSTSN
jgi:hypothetical protein